MMRIGFCLLTIAFLISPFASASPWSELEPGTLLTLKAPLRLEEGFRFRKGGTFALNQTTFLDSIQVEALSLRYFPCPRAYADKKAALQILDEKYGLEMNVNCEITLFVEMKDFYRESLFEAPPR